MKLPERPKGPGRGGRRPGSGRPRVYGTELPVYDDMTMASAATKIPIETFRHAKKNGCLFVRYSRVHLDVFLDWWFNGGLDAKDDPDAKEVWDKRDKRAVALTRETNLEKLRTQLIEFASVDRLIGDIVAVAYYGELERLAQQLPAVLKGKNEVEISREVLREIENIKKNIEVKLKTFREKKEYANC